MLLEFNEEQEGDQQETPQAVAPKEEEQTLEDLLECPNHRPTSFLKGKPRSILSLLVFYKILLESFMFDIGGYQSTVSYICYPGKEPWGNVNGGRWSLCVG